MTVKLRAIEPEDLDFLYQIENDQSNWNVSAEYAPISRRDLENYLYTYDRDPFRSGNLRMAICDTESDIPVGLIDLYEIDAKNRNAKIGITISKQYKQKGYGIAALEQICQYSHEILSLNVLVAFVGENNKASIALFKRAGFSQCGTLPKWLIHKGKEFDMIMFCRLMQ